MKKNINDRPYSKKVTEAALFAIDMIKRTRRNGVKNDSQISKAIGCAVQTVHNMRTGERAITIDQLGSLINQFGVDPKFLMKQEGSVWGEAELLMRVNALEKRIEIAELKLDIKPPEKK